MNPDISDHSEPLKVLAGASRTAATRPARAGREATRLPESLGRRLSTYALAAGAAGVGLLALAPAANAGIVYKQVNLTIAAGDSPPGALTGIDLNGDGINDLSFQHWIHGSNSRFTFRSYETALIPPIDRGPRGLILGPLATGYQIGPGDNLGGGGRVKGFVLTPETRINSGAWATALGGFYGAGFLGVELAIDGQAHYGWLYLAIEVPLVSRDGSSGDDAVLDYAYETNPNESIRAGQTSDAPEPGTLGLLALGALGLGLWRRAKTSPAR